MATIIKPATAYGPILLDTGDTLHHVVQLENDYTIPSHTYGLGDARFAILEEISDLVDRASSLYADANLQLYLPLDGPNNYGLTTGDWADISGNGRHGTPSTTAPTAVASGVIGSMMKPGTNDGPSYIEVDDHADIRGDQDLTIAFWLYRLSQPKAARLTSPVDKAEGPGDDYRFSFHDDGTLDYYHFESGGGVELVTTAALTLNAWSFIVTKWDEAAKVAHISVNAGAWTSSGGGATGGAGDTNSLWVGKESGNNDAEPPWYLDELSIWNRLLTDAEVARLYNSGNAFRPPGMMQTA